MTLNWLDLVMVAIYAAGGILFGLLVSLSACFVWAWLLDRRDEQEARRRELGDEYWWRN